MDSLYLPLYMHVFIHVFKAQIQIKCEWNGEREREGKQQTHY